MAEKLWQPLFFTITLKCKVDQLTGQEYDPCHPTLQQTLPAGKSFPRFLHFKEVINADYAKKKP